MSEELRNENLQDENDSFAGLDDFEEYEDDFVDLDNLEENEDGSLAESSIEKDDIFAGLDDYAANTSVTLEEESKDSIAELDQANLEGFAKGFPAWALEPPTDFWDIIKKQQ